MQKYGLHIPGRLVLDLNSPIGFRLEQVPQEASLKPPVPADLQEMYESSKLDTTMFVGSDIRALIGRIATLEENALVGNVRVLECKSEDGITVGLIDAVISICRVLSKHSNLHSPTTAIMDAMEDLRSDPDVRMVCDLNAERLLKSLEEADAGTLTKRLADKQGECERLRLALDIISNHGVQYPWAECARIARAALAQLPADK
jgi:hypothetical protein